MQLIRKQYQCTYVHSSCHCDNQSRIRHKLNIKKLNDWQSSQLRKIIQIAIICYSLAIFKKIEKVTVEKYFLMRVPLHRSCIYLIQSQKLLRGHAAAIALFDILPFLLFALPLLLVVLLCGLLHKVKHLLHSLNVPRTRTRERDNIRYLVSRLLD